MGNVRDFSDKQSDRSRKCSAVSSDCYWWMAEPISPQPALTLTPFGAGVLSRKVPPNKCMA